MMRDAILKFAEQFKYKPIVENATKLKRAKRFVVCGMGGSHLAAGVVKAVMPELSVTVHRDYGLPAVGASDAKESLFIMSSYSGNTEEVIAGFHEARKKGYDLAVIAVGGELLKLAQKHQVPFVKLPNTGIQPRSALGFSIKALLKVMRQENILKKVGMLAGRLKVKDLEKTGKKLASQLINKVPVVYASTRNREVAYNWKIKFNETGKIPAFSNVVPELNHNEMTGFDVGKKSRQLSEKFVFVLLVDDKDDSRVIKRFKVLSKLYSDRSLPVVTVPLTGKTVWERTFNSLIVADWTALALAKHYDLESEAVPMVEEFKKLISGKQ
ncbi:MAG: SIS domain-containing protein [bacterium]